MHGSIRSELESLLAGQASADVSRHVGACQECSSDIAAIREQNDLLRSLRSDEELEPSGGFYARVMQRIEERTKDSIWAVFVYSPFGKRLAFASLSMAVIMGSYVVAQERRDGHLLQGDTAVAYHYDLPMDGNQAQLRDAVLQNFASHDGELH